jgi:hypothetical protein
MLTALAAGFNVHHVDNNKTNNDPDNLLMVERCDHMKIHDMPNFLNKKEAPSWDSYAKRVILGESAYSMRATTSMAWLDIAQELGYKRDAQALNVAKAYAVYNKLAWPIPHHKDCECRVCGSSGVKRKKVEPRKYVEPDFVLMCLDGDGNEYPA